MNLMVKHAMFIRKLNFQKFSYGMRGRGKIFDTCWYKNFRLEWCFKVKNNNGNRVSPHMLYILETKFSKIFSQSRWMWHHSWLKYQYFDLNMAPNLKIITTGIDTAPNLTWILWSIMPHFIVTCIFLNFPKVKMGVALVTRSACLKVWISLKYDF